MQVVSIVTPNALHYPFAKSLLKAGFNVVCEKPMTMTVNEAEELEKLVAEKQTYICSYSYLYRLSDDQTDEGSDCKRSSLELFSVLMPSIIRDG